MFQIVTKREGRDPTSKKRIFPWIHENKGPVRSIALFRATVDKAMGLQEATLNICTARRTFEASWWKNINEVAGCIAYSLSKLTSNVTPLRLCTKNA